MGAPFSFDFLKPDYVSVWEWRVKTITRIRENPGTLEAFKEFYRYNPGAFITHWGSTFDPRNADIDLPTTIPFVLFDKQEDWIVWALERWRGREPGLTEKSRDMGLSWLSTALACTLCLFHDGISIGFGSRKEEYVDKIGDPKCLFWKARMFMAKLPKDFRGDWNLKLHAPHMRLLFPETGSSITGESGDGIGRGDRKSIYFVDEAAYIERPQLIEASLSATTNCRIDISSVHGMANPFAQKVHSGKYNVFTFHWRDDPRKGDEWYKKQQNDLDAVTLAQEVDINYTASVDGVVIPSDWVQSAVGAAEKLGIEPTGKTSGALDVADEGIDLNAYGAKRGIELFAMEAWSGKGSDTLHTSERAFRLSHDLDCVDFLYDADGLGAFVRGDSRMINERRRSNGEREIAIAPFRGSAAVIMPESQLIKGRKNKDYFFNFKAQAWWSVRLRFQLTYRVINGEITDYNPDDIISISPKLPLLSKLIVEMSQPTFAENTVGKMLINKKPDGTKSPNLADVVMMLYSPRRTGLFS